MSASKKSDVTNNQQTQPTVFENKLTMETKRRAIQVAKSWVKKTNTVLYEIHENNLRAKMILARMAQYIALHDVYNSADMKNKRREKTFKDSVDIISLIEKYESMQVSDRIDKDKNDKTKESRCDEEDNYNESTYGEKAYADLLGYFVTLGYKGEKFPEECAKVYERGKKKKIHEVKSTKMYFDEEYGSIRPTDENSKFNEQIPLHICVITEQFLFELRRKIDMDMAKSIVVLAREMINEDRLGSSPRRCISSTVKKVGDSMGETEEDTREYSRDVITGLAEVIQANSFVKEDMKSTIRKSFLVFLAAIADTKIVEKFRREYEEEYNVWYNDTESKDRLETVNKIEYITIGPISQNKIIMTRNERKAILWKTIQSMIIVKVLTEMTSIEVARWTGDCDIIYGISNEIQVDENLLSRISLDNKIWNSIRLGPDT